MRRKGIAIILQRHGEQAAQVTDTCNADINELFLTSEAN